MGLPITSSGFETVAGVRGLRMTLGLGGGGITQE